MNRIGINGEGVVVIPTGEHKDKVCFVEGALPNEVVDISITSNKKKFCIGKLESILDVSSDRITPQCQYFGICGGCDIQHINNELQIKFKQQNVKETIKKISGLDIDVNLTIRLNDYGYRNKMVFPCVDLYDSCTIGMFAKGSHDVVNIEKCLLTSNSINNLLAISKMYFQQSGLHGYNYKTCEGDIKYIVVRESKNAVLVTIVTTHSINLEEYYDILSKNFDSVGLSMVISDSNCEIMSGEYKYINGLKYLELEEYGIKYKVDNRGFLQVNNKIKCYLYKSVLDEISDSDTVIDAYSGAGLLSAIMAKKCKHVYGIEINKSAVNSAKNLAIDNKLSNVSYICGDVKNNIKDCLNEKSNIVVVLDPPRSGVDDVVLETILNYNDCDNLSKYGENSNNCRVSKIIYISCNVATLARDLKVLSKRYNIKSITPLDMFPQTRHVETLVVMDLK